MLASIEEDDTIDNIVSASPASCDDDSVSETVYAPVRDFVPRCFWQYCPNAFLDSAVVATSAQDDLLQACYPETFINTFIIPPCTRQSDFHSNSSVVNRLHDSVPVRIFAAMVAAGITDVLQNKQLDTLNEHLWAG